MTMNEVIKFAALGYGFRFNAEASTCNSTIANALRGEGPLYGFNAEGRLELRRIETDKAIGPWVCKTSEVISVQRDGEEIVFKTFSGSMYAFTIVKV